MGSGRLAVIAIGDSGLWYWCGLGWWAPWGTGRALLPLERVLCVQNPLAATLLGCWGSCRLGVLLCW